MDERADPPPIDAPDRTTLFSVLQLPAFRWYLAGQTAAAAATSALPVFTGWLSFDLTGSFKALGVISLFATLTGAVALLPAGVVADRYPRRSVLVLSHVGLALVMLALAPLTASEWGAYWVLFVLRGLAGALGSFAFIAQLAVLPAIVGDRRLQAAVAWRGVGLMIGGFVGSVVIGAAISFAAALAPVVIAGCALLAAFAFSRIASAGEVPPQAAQIGGVRDLIRLVTRSAVLRGLLAFSLLVIVFSPGSSISRVLDLMRVDPVGSGLALSGVVVIAALIPLLLVVRRPIRRAGRTAVIGFALSVLAGTFLALPISLPVAVAATFFGLLGDGLWLLLFIPILLEVTPDRLRGRVLAVGDLAALLVGRAAARLIDSSVSGLGENFVSVGLGAVGLLGAFFVARAFPAFWRYESVARRASAETSDAAGG